MKKILLFLITTLCTLTSIFGISTLTSCQTINESGEYILENTSTYFSGEDKPCFTINSNNISLDCNGETILGSNLNSGILINAVQNITINSCKISNFTKGLTLQNSNYSTINRVESSNTDTGIFIINSNEILISRSTIKKTNTSLQIDNTTSLLILDFFTQEIKKGLAISNSISPLIENFVVLEADKGATITNTKNLSLKFFIAEKTGTGLYVENVTLSNFSSVFFENISNIAFIVNKSSKNLLNYSISYAANNGFLFQNSNNNTITNISFLETSNLSWTVYFSNSADNIFFANDLQTKNKIIRTNNESQNIWTYSVNGTSYGNYWDDFLCFSYENESNAKACTNPSVYLISTSEQDIAPQTKQNKKNAFLLTEYSRHPLNYNKSLESIFDSITYQNSASLAYNTWNSLSGNLSGEIKQNLTLDNGKFTILNTSEKIQKGLYYNASEEFLSYKIEISNLNFTKNFENENKAKINIIGTPIMLLGKQYAILQFKNQSSFFNSLTIGEAKGKIFITENSIQTLNLKNSQVNISLITVSEKNKVLAKINEQYIFFNLYETLEIDNYYFTLASLRLAETENEKTVAEFIISDKIIELNDSQYVKVNGYELNETNFETNYIVTSNFSEELSQIDIKYYVKNETFLSENQSLEDIVFSSFAISYEGINPLTYSTLDITTTNSTINFNGTFKNNIQIPNEITLITNSSENSPLYLGTSSKRVYHQGSDLINIPLLFQENSLRGIEYLGGTTIGFNITTLPTDIPENLILFRLYDQDEFYLYKINSINTTNKTINFSEILTSRSTTLNIGELENQLIPNLSPGTIFNNSDTFFLNLSNLGNPDLPLTNFFYVNFLESETENFNSTTKTAFLNFSYDLNKISLDENSPKPDDFFLSFLRAENSSENITCYIENPNLFLFQKKFNNGTEYESYIDNYGTEIFINSLKKDTVRLNIPEKEVQAVVTLYFGEENTTQVKEIFPTPNTSLLSSNKVNTSWYLLCKENCTLDSFAIFVIEENLTNTPRNLNIFYSANQLSPKLLEISFDTSYLQGYHYIIANLNLSNGSQEVFTEYYFNTYEYNLTSLKNKILSDENLLLNVSFVYEPVKEIFNPDNRTYFLLSYYNLTTQNYEHVKFGSYEIPISKSGVYNFTLLGYPDSYPKLGNYSLSLFTKDANQKEKLQFSVYERAPKITSISLANNSVISSSNRGVKLILGFDSKVYNLSYQNLVTGKNYTFYSENPTEIWNISLLSNIGVNVLNLTFANKYGLKNSTVLNYTLVLNLNGSSNDSDGDGINNSDDKVFGNNSNIYTNIENLSLRINNSENLSKIFNSSLNISLFRENRKIIEFEKNFANATINLTELVIRDTREDNHSRLLISGIELEDKTKKIYFDLLGDTGKFASLCIKDEDIEDFSEMSINCTGSNELYIAEIPSIVGNYTISYINASNSTVEITGLSHSAVSQVCTENWTYSVWSPCTNTVQTRTATDSNACGTTNSRENLTQSCSESSSGGGGTSSSSSSQKKETPEDSSQNVEKNMLNLPPKFQEHFQLLVNENSNLNKNLTGIKKITIKEKSSNKTILEFEFNFSSRFLNLSTIEIQKGKQRDKNYIIIKGIELFGETKILHLKRNKNSSFVCIKDEEISSISEISEQCDEKSEYFLPCDSREYGGYMCRIETEEFVISGLRHSAVLEKENPIITTEEKAIQEKQIEVNKTVTDLTPEVDKVEDKSRKMQLILYLIGGSILTIGLLVVIILLIVRKK